MAEKYPIVGIYHILFTHLLGDGHLGCFHFLVIVNDAAVNIHVRALYGRMYSLLLVYT